MARERRHWNNIPSGSIINNSSSTARRMEEWQINQERVEDRLAEHRNAERVATVTKTTCAAHVGETLRANTGLSQHHDELT